MEPRSPPAAPKVPETAIVLAVALAAAAALATVAVTGFGATAADWPGLTAAAAVILFSGLAVLAGAPRGWRWVGATVCAHLGLHPWLAAAAAQQPATVFAVAVVALALWVAFAVLGRHSLRGWTAALLLGLPIGLSALLRPDLLALTLPLGALALWLAESPRPVLAAFAATAAAASLAGLAPVTRESGNWKGYSFIQGGRHRVRTLLYMPAVVAIQHNPDLKRKYEALLARGKPLKVALTAVMRKLLVLANALVQQDRTWTAQPPREYSCPAFPAPSPAGSVHG